jgi:NADH dehydrogenase (ubiquinone) 1 beta subcomplex subunit 9
MPLILYVKVVDMWHPLERAQYPEYFARREQRKKEFIERWEKKYGKAEMDSHH